MAKRSVAVRIGGQEYRILSEADEASLHRVASYVDDSMARIRSRTGAVDSLDVAVLTALNLARDLLATRESDGPGDTAGIRPERLRALIDAVEATTAGAAPHRDSQP